MSKLYMTKGLPGSGKTTWAHEFLERNPNTVLVSKDDLRATMFNSAWTKGREKEILAVRDFIVTQGLQLKKNVIVHDTNFVPKHEQRLREIAKLSDSDFEIVDFTHIPVAQCIEQDLRRPDSVGEKVIKQMYNDWLKPNPPVIKRDPKLPNAIICDLDGTLALFGDENPYERDFGMDSINEVVANILYRIDDDNFDGKGPYTDIIFVSGRNDKFRDVTEEWLRENGFTTRLLYMRKDGDERKDFVVKREIYGNYIKDQYNVQFVLDDRNQVVELWRSLGLTCLQVAEGDF